MKIYNTQEEIDADIVDGVLKSDCSIRITFNCVIKGSLRIAGDINAGIIDAWNIKAKNVKAGDIYAWDVDVLGIIAKNIEVKSLKAWSIDAEENIVVEGDIKAEEDVKGMSIVANSVKGRMIEALNIQVADGIKARKIKVIGIDMRGDINAGDINACGDITVEGDIKATDINARIVKAWSIKAEGYIKARSIVFYDFCIAYLSINCLAITGLRKNSFYKSLDGDVFVDKFFKNNNN